jgi:hypothetical protein
MRQAGQVAWERWRNAYKILVGKHEGKWLLVRHRCRWKDDIKREIRERGCGNMNWIPLAQVRDQWWAPGNMVMDLWISWNAVNLTSWVT